MSTKICTTIEQSKKLLSLGLDPSTADMCWTKYIDNGDITSLHVTVNYGIVPIDYPCWSLTALLELMPYFITIKEEGEPDEYYHFQLSKIGSVFHSIWHASYRGLKTERGKTHIRRIYWAVGPKKESETSLDAAFEMVCWLIEQGHIKVNK